MSVPYYTCEKKIYKRKSRKSEVNYYNFFPVCAVVSEEMNDLFRFSKIILIFLKGWGKQRRCGHRVVSGVNLTLYDLSSLQKEKDIISTYTGRTYRGDGVLKRLTGVDPRKNSTPVNGSDYLFI